MNENVDISNSILSSVKKFVGVSEDDESFDLEVMMNINAALSVLYQIGGIPRPFAIISEEDIYDDIIPEDSEDREDIISQIKIYLECKTKLIFDSSTLSASYIGILKEQVKESEWRLMDTFE